MNALKKYFSLLLGLVLLAVGGLAWTQHLEIIKLQAQLLDPNERSEMLKRLADAQKQLKSLRGQLTAMRSQGDDGAVADAVPAANNGGGRRGRGGFGAFQAMLNNPQFQKLMAVQQKAQLDARYASLFKTLNLTPDQLDQFKNLLVQKQQALQDARTAALQEGINPRTDPQGFAEAVQSAESGVDSQIQAALGDTAFETYQQYDQTLPQRTTVNQVQQALSYSQTPLTDDQASQLVQMLAQDTTQSTGNGGGGGRGGFGGGPFGGGGQAAPITSQDITMAQAILSAPQVAALQQVQQQQQAQQQMFQLMRANRQGGGGGGGGGGGAAANP